MFCHLHAPVQDVKDLTASDRLWLAVIEQSAASLAHIGRVNDGLVGLCYTGSWCEELSSKAGRAKGEGLLAFEFMNAGAKLMVELAFSNEFITLLCERAA